MINNEGLWLKIKAKKRWGKRSCLLVILFVSLLVLSACQELTNQGEVVMIKCLEDVKKIEGMGNIDRQVVIIYCEEKKAGISQLLIPLKDIKAGRKLSEKIDLIELDDQVDLNKLINRLKSHPSVLVAEKNSTAKTMPE